MRRLFDGRALNRRLRAGDGNGDGGRDYDVAYHGCRRSVLARGAELHFGRDSITRRPLARARGRVSRAVSGLELA
jgi:hypothetical protein